MALIKCSDCGKEISDKSSVCIHCGCPLEQVKEENKTIIKKEVEDTKENKKNKLFLILAGILVLVILIVVIIYFNNKDNVVVPYLENISEEMAVSTLRDNNLIPNVVYEYSDYYDEGKVISTYPYGGETLKKNDFVEVVVSKGPSVISSSSSTIEWYNITYSQDTWEFMNPYIQDDYLYIECEPTFAYSITWDKDGFGTASINDTFSKRVPVDIIYENAYALANVKQKITLKISTKDLDVKKPTTLYTKLVALKDGEQIEINANFTISW